MKGLPAPSWIQMPHERAESFTGLYREPYLFLGSRSARYVMKHCHILILVYVNVCIRTLFERFFYTFGFMKLPSICVLLSGFFFMIAAVLFAFRKEGRSFLPLSMLLPVAVAFGSVGGLYVYDVCASLFKGAKSWEVCHLPSVLWKCEARCIDLHMLDSRFGS